MKPLFLHDSKFHSLTPVSIFHSYETVASVLGPSSSTLAKVDHHPRPTEAVTSMDLKQNTVTPSDEFVPHFTDKATPRQGTEAQFGHIPTKHSTEYPSSADPYMWNLADDKASPSTTTNTDDRFLVCASMKKSPPFKGADIIELSKEYGEKVEKQEAYIDQCHTKGRSLKGQDSVYNESLLAKHQTEAEQDQVRTVLSSLQQDKW